MCPAVSRGLRAVRTGRPAQYLDGGRDLHGTRRGASELCPRSRGACESADVPGHLLCAPQYLEGCELFERGGRRNTLMAAEIFTALAGAHQSFALAHAGLAKALTFLGTYYV